MLGRKAENNSGWNTTVGGGEGGPHEAWQVWWGFRSFSELLWETMDGFGVRERLGGLRELENGDTFPGGIYILEGQGRAGNR